MADATRNTWAAKAWRTVTSILPVAPTRRGACGGCGLCCSLPNDCPFLRFHPDGTSFCAVYRFRPLNCRKYPRCANEHITRPQCGFTFDEP